ncbi:MAG: hypothetical protein ACHQT8_03290 [Chlamydiales bacterium]
MGILKNVFEHTNCVRAAVGGALGYATGVGVITGGAAGLTLPVYYRALGQMNPSEKETNRKAQAVLLAIATGYLAPVAVTYTAGVVAGALFTAAIPIAFVAYKIYTNYPQIAAGAKYVQYASSFIPTTTQSTTPSQAEECATTSEMPHKQYVQREEDKQGFRVYVEPGYTLLADV